MPSSIRPARTTAVPGRRGGRGTVTTSSVGFSLTRVREGLPSELLVDTYHYLIRASWPVLFGD